MSLAWPTREAEQAPPRCHPGDVAPRRSAVGARPGPGRLRKHACRGTARHPRAGPACRGPGLHPVLAGRAPQHAGHRLVGAHGRHRGRGRRHRTDPGRLRRCHAAEPPAAGGGRAVRDAGRAAPRPHRPRHRPRTRHRSGHRASTAPQHWSAVGRRLPSAAGRAGRLPARPLPRRTPLRRHHRRPGRRRGAADLAARVERLQRPAGRDARPALRVRPPLHGAEHVAGAGALPAQLRALRPAAGAVRHGRRAGRRRRDRRGGTAARSARRAGLPAAAKEPAGPAAHRRRRRRLTRGHRRSARSPRPGTRVRQSGASTRYAGSSATCCRPPRPTS